jgi:hypothetical protein
VPHDHCGAAATSLGTPLARCPLRVRLPPITGRYRMAARRLASQSGGLDACPCVTEAVVKKVNQKRITNSKDLRKLRTILPDPVAREHFLKDEGDLDSALLRVPYVDKKAPSPSSLTGELEAAVDAMKRVPWTALEGLRGDPEILKKLDDAEALLKSLRKTLASQ